MVISMFVVIFSILETICESHYYFRVVHHPHKSKVIERAPNPQDYRIPECGCPFQSNGTLEGQEYPPTEVHPYLDIIDDICMVSQSTT